MRTKSFILTFLMMMFCSIGFGQSGTGNHWNPDEHQYANNMDVIAIIEIDDVEQKTESLEVGAFCGTELRASSRPMKAPMLENRYIVFLDILGDEDDDLITFKLYDHSQGIELNYVIEKPINFRFGQDPLGSVDAPYVLEFLTPVAKIGDVHYRTLPLAVEAATAGQTVELIADATGAGVVINKDVTIDFGGNTYTINQAVGSAGTESQGFQLLKNNTVTLQNGYIAIAENTNVKWMFNAYANVTLAGLNVNCTNMATPAANEANYVLVVNNGGGATPTVNYNSVNVTNFPSTNQIWLDPTTTFKAVAGLENSIKTEAGYVVVYNNGEYTAVPAVAKIGDVYYRTLPLAVEAATAGQTVELIADATGAGLKINKDVTINFGGFTYTINQAVGSTGTESQGFQLLKDNTVILQNGYIAIAEGTNVKWMFNAYADVTLAGLNVNCANMKAPAENESNYVLVVNNGGGATPIVYYSGVNVTNFPTTEQIWLDPTTTFKAVAGLESSIETGEGYVVVYNNGEYTAVPAVASITADGTPTTYYETLAGAVEAATAGQTVNLLADATGAGLKINKDVTINFGGFTYTINQAVGSTGTESQGFQLLKNNTVTLKNGTIDIVAGTNVKWMFNAYADVTLENLNVNCANMAAPAENEANYVLVVNNGGSATPTVTYTNVTVTNFPSTATAQIWLDPTTTLKAGAGLESSIETGEGYVVVYNNGEYTAIGAVAKIGEAIYPSVAAAVAAAQAGDVIELLVNVTEDVTVNKNVTIDGGDKNYTGTMEGNAGLTITIQNVNFVNAGFAKNTKSTTGTYTFKDCTFDGAAKTYAYPLKFRGANKIIVENCTVKDYLYSFLYVPNSTNNVNVKNVTVENCPDYAVYFGSGVTSAIIENLTVKNSNRGLLINNTANRALTLKNCKLENVGTAVAEANGTNTITCTLLGNDNNFGTSATSQYAKYVLAEADATLTAPEGLNVTTSVAEYVVVYENAKYQLKPAVASITADGTTTYYETLAGAVEAATAGQTVNLLKAATGAGLKINKNVTIDFGGFTYTINQAVGSTGTESQGFQLLKNNTVTLKNGNIDIVAGTNVKWMFNAYADVTLENLNVNCANMAAPAENEANYVLVVNNGGSATPTVTYTNVTVTNFPSTATAQIWLDPRTTLKAGAGLENSIETEEGYVVVYNNGEYTAIGAVAKIGEAIYPSVAAAVAAAQAGDVIELLVNVTEDVTVNKSVTIDGANKNYTGGISAKGNANSTTVTVKNVNFVGNSNYAITTNLIKSITVENCTATNYSYGFLYANRSTPTVVVKNVTVQGGNYGFHWVYGTTATLENVTMINVTYGIMTQNYGAKTITIKNSSISGTNPIHVWERNTTVVDTFNFIDANTLSDLTTSAQAKLVLGNENALTSTLTAPAGFNVESGVNDYAVTYENGVYKLVVPTVKNVNTGKLYDKLQAAIDEASSGDEIEVLKDIEVNINDVEGLPTVGGYPTYYEVTGKTISIDLNGKTIKANVTATDILLGLFSTEQNGNLTFIDSSNGSGTVEVVASDDADVYALITNYEETSSITINNGNYRLNKTGKNGQSLIYDSPGNMVINGGNFHLGNIGTDGVNNGLPWIFNCYGKNDGHVTVNGGTFNADVNHQHWAHEVYVPNTLALKDNGNDTWTVVPAVAQGTDSWKGYNRSLGYASIADAAHWAKAETTVTVVADHAITETAIVESNITLDFAGKEVTCSANPAIRIQGNVNVTVKNGNMNTEGYNFILGASDGSSAGNLTIESGTFHGATTVASVTMGSLNITDGEFSVEPYQGNYAFLINCYDPNYNNGAEVSISGGTFHKWNPENNAAEGVNTNFCAPGHVAVYDAVNDTYTVIEANYVAKIGEVKYISLQAAIDAAQGGNTIVLLADITEDVTVNKSLTIDGANFEYTGNIAVSGTSTAMTVKNVNFIDGTGYAVTTNRIKSITVENCTVTNYGFGFLYANKSTPTVVVKNVTVDGGNYGFHWVYGTTATLENVTMTNVTNGLYIQNYAGKTISVKGCNITNIAIWEKASANQTFNFEGANTVGTLSSSQYAKYVLTATDATLTAPEGSTVTTTFDDYKVAYGDGKYYLKPCDYVAEIEGGAKYESLYAAIDAAQDRQTVIVLKDITLGYEDANDYFDPEKQYKSFFNISGKAVTVNLNEKTVKAVLEGEETVMAFFSTENGGDLTIKGGNLEIDTEKAVYSLLVCYTGGKLTVENGNYKLNLAADDLVYTQEDNNVVINGGTFHLGNVGTGQNGQPWIINAKGQNSANVDVNGGTFNADINHQFWANEVYVPETLALKDNGDGTWTVVESVAYVEEIATSTNAYSRKVGYAKLAEAVNPLGNSVDNTVTVIKSHELAETVIVNKNVNIDFAEKDVEGSLTPAIRIQGGANVTIKNGKMNTTGYNFILGASDGSSAGNLTIESGEYHAQTSVVSVTKGHLNITGGEFSVEPYQGNYAYLINCIDANYEDGSAKVSISGGTFHNWNPQNNAAEGANTNFCASGYGAVEKSTGVWEVVPMQGMKLLAGWNWFSSYIDINGEAGLVKLQDALNPYGVQIKGNGGFTQYTEGQGWFGPNLPSVSVKEMYMINMTEDHELQLKGELVDPDQNVITLKHNWNWIGYQLNQELDLNDALSKLSANNGDFIKTHNGIAQYIQDYGWWGTLTTMKPGVGYMYYNISADDNTLVYSYPEEGAKTELRTNVTSDNNRWVPVSYKYAHNMNIIAVVEGMESENYEIAAFVGGEVRGSARPIYVEPLDANIVFLTIYGDDVEEMTFKCYDLATGEEYDLNNRMNYSDDAVVGSIDNPYLLSRGTTGIGESALTEVNIYPNPTTTGSEVNLGSVCDTVEVFNALGVKIAEYRNVDSIDALETAGIYVIRITNDGNVQNCRLIVK